MNINLSTLFILCASFYAALSMVITQESATQPIAVQSNNDLLSLYKHDQQPGFRDDRNNITEAELAQIKNLIKEAENLFQPNQMTQIGKYIYDNLTGPTKNQKWNIFIYTPKINEIRMNSYKVHENKTIWLSGSGVSKYNLTYAMFQIWTCALAVPGGFTTAPFGENINDTVKQKLTQIVNNSILYQGQDMYAAAQYIQSKINLIIGCRWNVIISNSSVALETNSFAYYRCDCYNKWAHFKAFGEFKWNYFIWAD